MEDDLTRVIAIVGIAIFVFLWVVFNGDWMAGVKYTVFALAVLAAVYFVARRLI